tara:strand:+ start:6454 stop:6651 length:198 start_codon:yes stop_codon:yes gene_type:complete
MAIKLCDKYDSLSPIERLTLVGEIVHALQSSDEIFDDVQKIIKKAILQGLFIGTTILPPENNTNE